MSDFIPLSIPNLSDLEKKYVIEALDDGWVSSVGPHVDKFEQRFAEFVGSKYAVACSSGTAALHVTLLLMGVEHGDEVLIPNLTFVATANAVAYAGAEPVLLDIDKSTLGIDTNSLQAFIKEHTEEKNGHLYNLNTGRRVKAILPVHMLGTPVDMNPLLELCRQNNIAVIEDATESLGSNYKGEPTGTLSEIACFSFNGNKVITTGGGGMITTDNEALAKRAKHITTTAKTDSVFFEHDEIGFNYRLVNILAALGLGQLERIDSFLEVKRKTQENYLNKLSGLEGVELFNAPDGYDSNYWLNMVSFSDQVIKDRGLRGLVEHFQQKGIQTRPMWTLIADLPIYSHCFKMPQINSVDLHKRSLSIPSSTCISENQIDRVVSAIKELL